MNELKTLGLHDGKNWLVNQKIKEALVSGQLTPFVQLKDLKIDGAEGINLDAKLSLRRDDQGTVKLAVHPIFKHPAGHPLLSREDELYMNLDGVYARKEAAWGVITQRGAAPYRFVPDNPSSPFVELEKPDGKKDRIWGADIARAVSAANFKVGDAVMVKLDGRELVPSPDDPKQTISRLNWKVQQLQQEKVEDVQALYEFDKQTNSTVRTDDRQYLLPEQINGIDLSPREKERLRRGGDVELRDGSRLQLSPASETRFRSNRLLLLATMFIDGGMSYAIFKGVNALLENGKKVKQEKQEYSRGYMDALKKVQQDLEHKQARFPNDDQIARDLDLVREEALRVSELPVASYGEIKARVNDPELGRNAHDRQSEESMERIEHAEQPLQDLNSKEETIRGVVDQAENRGMKR